MDKAAGFRAGRSSARFAHHDTIHDLKIDTTFESPQAAAVAIKKALDSGLEPAAFTRMRTTPVKAPVGWNLPAPSGLARHGGKK